MDKTAAWVLIITIMVWGSVGLTTDTTTVQGVGSTDTCYAIAHGHAKRVREADRSNNIREIVVTCARVAP